LIIGGNWKCEISCVPVDCRSWKVKFSSHVFINFSILISCKITEFLGCCWSCKFETVINDFHLSLCFLLWRIYFCISSHLCVQTDIFESSSFFFLFHFFFVPKFSFATCFEDHHILLDCYSINFKYVKYLPFIKPLNACVRYF
jgi:hypothetical protein